MPLDPSIQEDDMRHIIELHVINRSDEGQFETGHRSHIITLSNKDAVRRVFEAISGGNIAWEDVLEVTDVLVYDEKLDYAS